MSLRALAIAVRTPLADGNAQTILVQLADAHNDHTDECFISQATIMAQTGLSSSTVYRAVKRLEEKGMIARTEKQREDGGRDITHYDLLFLPVAAHAPPRKTKPRSLPPEDWTPSPEIMARLRKRYPHHEIDEGYLVREFIGFCHARNQTYANFDAAFSNSAERHLRRQSASIARLGEAPRRQSRAAGGVSGAVRDLLSGTGD